jgi:homoaconitase/3-isopropylmalate dehydratase large subunit
VRNEKELCSSNVAIEAGAKKKVKASKTAFEFYCEGGKRDKYSKKNPNASEAALIDQRRVL